MWHTGAVNATCINRRAPFTQHSKCLIEIGNALLSKLVVATGDVNPAHQDQRIHLVRVVAQYPVQALPGLLVLPR